MRRRVGKNHLQKLLCVGSLAFSYLISMCIMNLQLLFSLPVAFDVFCVFLVYAFVCYHCHSSVLYSCFAII